MNPTRDFLGAPALGAFLVYHRVHLLGGSLACLWGTDQNRCFALQRPFRNAPISKIENNKLLMKLGQFPSHAHFALSENGVGVFQSCGKPGEPLEEH